MVTISRGCIALLLVIACGTCRAQERLAMLTGTVRGKGRGLPRVTVRVRRHDSRHLIAAGKTAGDGYFAFANLPCGNDFTLVLSRCGWLARHIRHLQLRCESTLRVTVTMYSAAEPFGDRVEVLNP